MYLNVPASPYYGYGVCGTYLLAEFAKRGTVYIDPAGELLPWGNDFDSLIAKNTRKLTGDVYVPLLQFPVDDFDPPCFYRGKPTALYLFSEWEITEKQKENLKRYDVLIAGSEWNAQVIRDAGFKCHAVPQGVDQSVFRPLPREKFKDRFVIFSGGKWEPRKGQDLVMLAAKIFHKRHPDVLLITSWFNIWDHLRRFTADFPHYESGLCSQNKLCELMNMTDVGVFPNRCEGGTNLVMMEYLSCGKPVIANFGTGQKDVLENSYALEAKSVDEIIEQLEILYCDKKRREEMGAAATKAMHLWPWSKTADGIEGAINEQR